MHHRGLGHQRLESAGPPPAGPPVQRVARDPDLLAERAGVGGGGKLTHPLAALAGRQPWIDQILDQPVTEQADLLSTFGPPFGLIFGFGHLLSSSARGETEPTDADRKWPLVTMSGLC